MRERPTIGDLRAAAWTLRALAHAHRRLAEGQMRVDLPEPPPLPRGAVRGVEATLRRRTHTCLEGALVRQRWWAAHGVAHDVVVGVTSPAAGFSAHAWLDDGRDAGAGEHAEIARLAATRLIVREPESARPGPTAASRTQSSARSRRGRRGHA